MLGVFSLIKTVISGVTGYVEKKQELKRAVIDNKIFLARNKQSHNQDWEMKSLENAGWKDEVLFLSIIGMFIWAGFDPDGAREYFENLKVLPEWFVKIFMWLVASILGVKKIGDYLPSLVKSVKSAIKQ